MLLPFFLRKFAGHRDEIVVIDLSTPITKAVHLRRKGDRLALVNYCLQKAPSEEKEISPKLLAEHLKSVRQALGAKTPDTILVIGMENSTLRNVEVPLTKRSEMRRALTLNARHIFAESLPDLAFDCFTPAGKRSDDGTPQLGQHSNVLVGTVKRDFPGELQRAAGLAGLNLIAITPVQAALANAALVGMDKHFVGSEQDLELVELANAALATPEALVLLHIGPDTSTVSFLVKGTLVLTRAIDIGSNQLGKGLAEACNTLPMVEEFKTSIIIYNVQKVLAPLAQEVRAAIDYFDHREGLQVVAGFVAGDLAQSSQIVATLQVLEIPCQRLDPTEFLATEEPAERKGEIEKDLPQLDLAIGAAVGWSNPDGIEINLLAEEINAAEFRRRDPVRWTIGVGVAVVLFLLVWAGSLRLQTVRADTHLRQTHDEWMSLEKAHHIAMDIFKQLGEVEHTIAPLQEHATNRFLWALPLNALQVAMVDSIQVVGLKMEQTLVQVEAVKAANNAPARPALTKEQILLTITAKNFTDTQAEDKFIERLASQPYFKNSLRKKEPVILKNRMPQQVDPLDAKKTFTLFTIECIYPERVLGRE